MGARQEAKHEKILRELLRQPDNKRCPNCDSLVRAAVAAPSLTLRC